MPLPNTVSPPVAYFDVQTGYVNISSSVFSVVDQISGLAASQTVVANQPTFSAVALTNLLGGLSFAGITFGGSAFLSFNRLATLLSGSGSNSFTLMVVASCSAPASSTQSLLAFGNSGSNTTTELFVNASNVGVIDRNDAGTSVTASDSTVLDTKAHVYTVINNLATGIITVNKDGVQDFTLSGAGGVHTYNTFTIGGRANNGSTLELFNGTIGSVVAWFGAADYTLVEDYMLNRYLNTDLEG